MTAGKTAREFLMKRNKVIAVAVVVMMMVGAVVLMSCSNCPGDGNCKVSSENDISGMLDSCFGDVAKKVATGDATQEDLYNQMKTCFGDATSFPVTCDC
jgi:hypothetical protein